jgi:hypothetical protein
MCPTLSSALSLPQAATPAKASTTHAATRCFSECRWKGSLQQYVGRLHRLYDNKRVVEVYDYVDSMAARMYERARGATPTWAIATSGLPEQPRLI